DHAIAVLPAAHAEIVDLAVRRQGSGPAQELEGAHVAPQIVVPIPDRERAVRATDRLDGIGTARDLKRVAERDVDRRDLQRAGLGLGAGRGAGVLGDGDEPRTSTESLSNHGLILVVRAHGFRIAGRVDFRSDSLEVREIRANSLLLEPLARSFDLRAARARVE